MRTIVKRNNTSLMAIGTQQVLPGVEYVPHGYITRVGDAVYNAISPVSALYTASGMRYTTRSPARSRSWTMQWTGWR